MGFRKTKYYDGTIKYVVELPWPDRGSSRPRKYLPNRQQAKILSDRVTTAINDGTWRDLRNELEGKEPVKKLTLRQFANRWIENKCKVELASWSNYDRALNALCEMKSSEGYRFGDVPLEEFRRRHLREFEEIRRKSMSIASVNRDLAAIRSMFSYALELELVDLHPLLKLRMPKEQEYRFIPLTPEEVERIIQSQTHKAIHDYVLILSETALRKSEGLQLTWSQIDWANKVLTTAKTKNHRSRDIPLSDVALTCLRGIADSLPVSSMKWRCPEVFCWTSGRTPLRCPDRSFTKSVTAAGLERKIGFHDLRRYRAGEWHYRQGLSVREVQYLLGHSDIKVTERYLGIDRGLAERVRRLQNSQTQLYNVVNFEPQMTIR